MMKRSIAVLTEGGCEQNAGENFCGSKEETNGKKKGSFSFCERKLSTEGSSKKKTRGEKKKDVREVVYSFSFFMYSPQKKWEASEE